MSASRSPQEGAWATSAFNTCTSSCPNPLCCLLRVLDQHLQAFRLGAREVILAFILKHCQITGPGRVITKRFARFPSQ